MREDFDREQEELKRQANENAFLKQLVNETRLELKKEIENIVRLESKIADLVENSTILSSQWRPQ